MTEFVGVEPPTRALPRFSNLVNPDLMLRSVVFNQFTITAHCLKSISSSIV